MSLCKYPPITWKYKYLAVANGLLDLLSEELIPIIKNSLLGSFYSNLVLKKRKRPWVTSIGREMSVYTPTKHVCSGIEWKKLEQSNHLYAATIYP